MSTIRMAMASPYKRPDNHVIYDGKPSNTGRVSSFGATIPLFRLRSFKCKAKTCNQTIRPERRSGNYNPPLWDFDFIQSLNSEYKEEKHLKRASELVVQLKMLLEEDMEPIQQLELIDDLQRLCISGHFEDKIYHILNGIYRERHQDNGKNHGNRDLYSTSLEFRLLRQHGLVLSQEVFDCFKNETGDFKSSIENDTKGLLQMYEASFMLTQGETTLETAKDFATKLLEKKLDDHEMDDYLSLLVRQALELPLHWRSQRPNARWFINAYETRKDKSPIMLELAKLDFNIVQATQQEELKCVSRWWMETGLAEKLPFVRDRLVESYFFAIGQFFERQHGYSRIVATKVNILVTVIDDIFDVYGTLEELNLFNNVIQRWDIEEMGKLPPYMQLCYLALNNFINETAYDVLKEQRSLIIPHLRKSWAELCRLYLQEAEWYFTGYTPKFDEFMSNAWISISARVVLSHVLFLVINPIENDAVQSLYKDHNIVQYCGTMSRLANDLGTSPDEMERGDVPKSIQCYMNETGADKEEACEYVKSLMYETWKKINQERVVDSPFPQEFVTSVIDLVRITQYIYQHGDGFGIHYPHMKDRISSLLLQPIVNHTLH